jgi:hypothetical protein
MTAEEWLECTDPTPMLEFLQGKASERKLRLFACACCRRIWHVLTDERSRKAIEASERFADRLITQRQLMAACGTAQKVAIKVLNTASPDPALVWAVQAAHEVAKSAQTIATRAELMTYLPGGIVNRIVCCAEALKASRFEESKQLAALLRCVFGNPFRQIEIDPAWLAWNEGTVVKLVQGIYDERGFDQLPVLADALEDAGCTNSAILDHCRQAGKHVRGCWVIDLLLVKE